MALVMRGVCLVALCALGCESVVDQSYRGAPLASLRAVVANESGKSFERPRAAVFWARSLDAREPSDFEEETSSSQPVRDGAGYVLHLFEAPALQLPWDGKDTERGRFALGRIFVYDDQNGNARRDDDEPMIGGLGPYGVLYAAEKLKARVGPSRRDLAPGLHFAWLPLPCRPDPEPNSVDCDVPLGMQCRAGSMECGAGECVDRFNFPWPGGGCMVSATRACVPEAGALLSGGPGGPYYAAACQSDDDCERGTPYRCDPVQGACVPFNVPRISLGEMSIAPFCGR